ncbi:hypothetical protein CMK12_07840 [Candidatus Poribacteria bacterium]|jgi:hypothetical protein|nr:hypothetical protein [Candidatus Poribacteria bacterium]
MERDQFGQCTTDQSIPKGKIVMNLLSIFHHIGKKQLDFRTRLPANSYSLPILSRFDTQEADIAAFRIYMISMPQLNFWRLFEQ